MAQPQPLGAWMRGVRRQLRRPVGPDPAVLQEMWSQAAGPEVAVRSRVRGCGDGVVWVEVASSALRAELQSFRRRELLDKMKTIAPELGLRKIRFLTGAE